MIPAQISGSTAGWFPTSVISDGTSFYTLIAAESNFGTGLYKVDIGDMTTGKTALYTGPTTATPLNTGSFSAIPCFYGTSNIMVPILNNVNIATGTN